MARGAGGEGARTTLISPSPTCFSTWVYSWPWQTMVYVVSVWVTPLVSVSVDRFAFQPAPKGRPMGGMIGFCALGFGGLPGGAGSFFSVVVFSPFLSVTLRSVRDPSTCVIT